MKVLDPDKANLLPQVVQADSVTPAIHPDDTISERPTVAFETLEQSLLECAPGTSQPRATGGCEETLFVLAGRGSLQAGSERFELEAESGATIAPSERYTIGNDGPGPLRLVAVRSAAEGQASPGIVVSHLRDQAAEAATTEREFRIVADPQSGLASATHFVGYIPAARAPDHFHTYDEVIYVLDGEGVFESGGIREPLRAGTCIRLPARAVHCLQNTGREVMRVVGVFRPAGSPAAAYYPDGTPAHDAAPPLERTMQAQPHRRRPNQ